MSAEYYRRMPLCEPLAKRAMIGAAYWLDCSPHEHTETDALIVAHYARLASERIAELEKQLAEKNDVIAGLRALHGDLQNRT